VRIMLTAYPPDRTQQRWTWDILANPVTESEG
jgi:hypothetical protein